MTPRTLALASHEQLLRDVERYITSYVTFANPDYAFAAALWLVGTFLWPHFDAFPYLTVTSDVKRSGKTRFSEILSFVASNPRNFAGMTAAALFRSIRDENPSVFIDEAETLSSEAASTMRAVLNVGYRRGQTIPRLGKGGVEEWPAYCPKVFILIGDVYDTLRDRSIIVRMQRAEPQRRFLYDHAKAEGQALRERIASVLDDKDGDGTRGRVIDGYTRHGGLPFLQDRDEEMWTPLFAACEAFAPSRVMELQRVAADLAVEKTGEARRYVNLLGAERDAEDEEYARRLLRDLHIVMTERLGVFTSTAIERLKELPTGPWRKYRGTGLAFMNLADLLSRFGVAPKLLKLRGKAGRGYRREDVERALKTL